MHTESLQDVPDMYGKGSESSPRSGRPVFIASMSEASVVERRQVLIGPETTFAPAAATRFTRSTLRTAPDDVTSTSACRACRGVIPSNMVQQPLCALLASTRKARTRNIMRAVRAGEPGRWSLMDQRMAMQCCSHASQKRSSRPRHIRSTQPSANYRSQTVSGHKFKLPVSVPEHQQAKLLETWLSAAH